MFTHITPALLDRVWSRDNVKGRVLWEMANMGSIFGDVFVKVTYERGWTDPVGINHAPRVRIIPLNPSFAFPRWHPHDKDRLEEFKLKYRFWSTDPAGTRVTNTYVEILTDTEIREYVNDELISQRPNPVGCIPIVHIQNAPAQGSAWGLSDIWEILSTNREYNEKMTEMSDIINYHCVDSATEALTRRGWKRYDELTDNDELLALDPDHDEMISWQPVQHVTVQHYDGDLIRWTSRIDALTTPEHRWLTERCAGRPNNKRYVPEIGRTSHAADGDMAFPDMRNGSRLILGGGIPLEFALEPKWSDELVETIGWYLTEGCDHYGYNNWHNVSISQSKPQHIPGIRRLKSYWERQGGTFSEYAPRANGVIVWLLGKGVKEALEAAAPGKALTPEFVCSLTYRQAVLLRDTLLAGDGTREAPGKANRASERRTWWQDDAGRKDGYQMLCAMLGIRSRQNDVAVFEYSMNHVLSETIRATAAPEKSSDGIVWCPTVAGGFWMARRNGNTYWTGNSNPITVITGGKAPSLDVGPNKIWGVDNDAAKVYNLENNFQGLQAAVQYVDLLKTYMFEATGVPINALGQEQAISNTSGVALSIQFMPTMMKTSLKQITYGQGLKSICSLALRTLFIFEPETMIYNPETDGIIQPGQPEILDRADPNVYDIDVDWVAPLPVDELIKLEEIQLKLGLRLESRKGALADLGEEFPDEKLLELAQELIEDTKDQAAIDMIKAQVAAILMELTGTVPDNGAEPVPPQPVTDAQGNQQPGPPSPVAAQAQGVNLPKPDIGSMVGADSRNLIAEIVTRAYGYKQQARRDIDKKPNQ